MASVNEESPKEIWSWNRATAMPEGPPNEHSSQQPLRMGHDGSVDNEASTFAAFDTPTTSVMGDAISLSDSIVRPNAVPKAGSVFMIRSIDSGHMLSLFEGQVVLSKHPSRGAVLWACIETNGWLGFRNIVSGKLLGYDNQSILRCTVDRHLEWEHFCVRPDEGGGYLLLMQHRKEFLWRVDKAEEGSQKLIKVNPTTGSTGLLWEFLEVEELL